MKRTLLLALLVLGLVATALAERPSRGIARELPEPGAAPSERLGPPGGEERRNRLGPPDRPAVFLDLSRTRPARAAADDHVIVRFEPEMPSWQRRQIVTAAGGAGYRPARADAFVRVDVAAGDSVEDLLARFDGMPGVVSAEADPYCWLPAGRVTATATAAAVEFTDPLFPLQWTLQRIRLPEALDLNPTFGAGVIVAVLDTGVAFGDGAAFPARRGLDLDGTSFLPGIDLVDGGPPFDEGSGGPGPNAPRFGHGTFVASQIAAGVNNGVSGGSVAPRVTILPVRVLGTDGFGSFSDVAEGIDFAVAQGARVINMSLGGEGGPSFVQAAVERAAAAGVVLVAAAGNEADDPDAPDDVSFPARFPQVIAVGATGFADQRADYSNIGPNLELMAPAGENAGADVGDGLPDGAVAPSFVHNLPAPGQTIYSTFSANGTSFATPQVAAGAALLVALGVDDPEVLRDLLQLTARDLGAPGFDNDTGHGLIDLLEAHRGLGFSF